MTAPDEPWVPEDTFGSRLALVRQAMKWNVKEAAEACGLNDQSWRNWEEGKRPRDLLDVAHKIAEATLINEAWIVMGGATRTGSFSPELTVLPEPVGQGQLLADDLTPVDFYRKAELVPV